jgi:hypothetical protein
MNLKSLPKELVFPGGLTLAPSGNSISYVTPTGWRLGRWVNGGVRIKFFMKQISLIRRTSQSKKSLVKIIFLRIIARLKVRKGNTIWARGKKRDRPLSIKSCLSPSLGFL